MKWWRSKPPAPLPSQSELEERVWARARRDTRLVSTNTIYGLIALAVAGGVGNHYAQKDHAPNKHPTALVELAGPVVGVIAGLVLVLIVRLLLTFRVQRNEARRALAASQRGSDSLAEEVSDLTERVDRVTTEHAAAEQRASAAEAATPQIAKYEAHGPTYLVAAEDVLKQIGWVEPRPTGPSVPPVQPGLLPSPQEPETEDDDSGDGAVEP